MKSIPYFISFLSLLLSLNVSAQSNSYPESILHQRSVQFNVGTQGIGAEFNYGILSALALRVGANVVPLKANDVFKISGFNSSSNVSADFYNVHAFADYVPFQNLSWLRLVGGVAYFFKARGHLRIVPSNDYTYGDLVLDEDQIGYVDLNVDWKGPAPYLGIGIVHLFPGKTFNVNFDLGTYYLNKPEANIIGTGILEGNSSQTSQFQSNIKDYRWLPVIQMSFNFKI